MNDFVFQNVPDEGNLSLEKILLEYDCEPIVFICKNEAKDFFFCICDDFLKNRSWIVVKTSINDIIGILKDEITLLSVFKKSKNKTIIVDYLPQIGQYSYTKKMFSEINPDELPYEDQYLDEKDFFGDYVFQLESELNGREYFNENLSAKCHVKYDFIQTDGFIEMQETVSKNMAAFFWVAA